MFLAPWYIFLSLIVKTGVESFLKPKIELHVAAIHSDFYIDVLDKVNRTISSVTFQWIKLTQFVLERLKQLCTAKMSVGLPPKSVPLDQKDARDNFDWRQERSDCPSVYLITDQGACGSCWAISAAHVMSDRLCIHSKGAIKDYVSAYNILTCNEYVRSEGCQGADPINAWRKYRNQGTTNGSFTTESGCQPYVIEPCNHLSTASMKPPCGHPIDTPSCSNICFGERDPVARYLKAKEIYQVLETNDIMKEIETNGPVQATFSVFASFAGYVSGVYSCPHSSSPEDPFLGYHSIRILGWGVENSVPFWLCSNSWDSDWGANGYFKIKKGSGKTPHGEGECGIESYVMAGIPQL